MNTQKRAPLLVLPGKNIADIAKSIGNVLWLIDFVVVREPVQLVLRRDA